MAATAGYQNMIEEITVRYLESFKDLQPKDPILI
jgi:hypothetical protein